MNNILFLGDDFTPYTKDYPTTLSASNNDTSAPQLKCKCHSFLLFIKLFLRIIYRWYQSLSAIFNSIGYARVQVAEGLYRTSGVPINRPPQVCSFNNLTKQYTCNDTWTWEWDENQGKLILRFEFVYHTYENHLSIFSSFWLKLAHIKTYF